jgi:hypothetical protein
MAATVSEDMVHRSLLATDFVPSSTQADFFKLAIDKTEKNIHDLDSRISTFELQLEELHTYRRVLLDTCAVKEALLAPVRKLHPEILGEIFTWCVADVVEVDTRATPKCAPLLLVHVCRRWRRVALATPRLWTQITLQCDPKVNPLVAVPLWLDHSGALPIDVDIIPEEWSPLPHLELLDPEADEIGGILQRIAQNFHRCRTFRCSGDAYLQGIFPQGSHTTAPFLHTFQVKPDDCTPLLRLGDISAPNLEVIDVSHPYLSVHSISFNHQLLRTLRLDAQQSLHLYTLDTLPQLLALCPNLEDCEFKYPFTSQATFTAQSISVPHLRRLSMTWSPIVDASPFLAALMVPKLEYIHLMIDGEHSEGSSLASALCALNSSSPPLKVVHIDNIHILPHEFLPILVDLTFLDTLYLTDVSLDHTLLAALTPETAHQAGSWMCPRLASLHLEYVDVPGDQLIRMIDTRSADYPLPEQRDRDFQHLTFVSLKDCTGLTWRSQAALVALARRRNGLCIEGLKPLFNSDDDFSCELPHAGQVPNY